MRILIGDCRERLAELADGSVHCCVTSPPYFGLRDYGHEGQMGLETTPEEFVAGMVEVFREVRRVLRDDGTLWLNIGDSYAGSWGAQGHRVTDSAQPSWHGSQIRNHPKRSRTGSVAGFQCKPKDLIGIPWMLAFALRADGWFLRQDIIWSKPNPMPESVRDRCTKAHEYLFLLSKGPRYYFDAEAIAEASTDKSPGNISHKGLTAYGAGDEKHRTKSGLVAYAERKRQSGKQHKQTALGQHIGGYLGSNDAYATRNKRSVWEIATQPFSEAHFATYPPALIEPCIQAGTSEKGCCSKCGAPWMRATKLTAPDGREAVVTQGRSAKGPDGKPLIGNNMTHPGEKGSFNATKGVLRREFAGWVAQCECNASMVQATVLDPFFGAGTTGLVADRLGRNCIGIELNPEYAAIAQRRLNADAGLFSEVEAA